MLLIRKINRKLPAALITIGTASLFVFVTGWANGENVALVDIPGQFGLRFHLSQIALNEVFPLMLSGAVSYTHLDVYKRQASRSGLFSASATASAPLKASPAAVVSTAATL